MSTQKNHKPSAKVWIEYNGTPILGKGGARILKEIETQQSLSKAAEKLCMSYRYLWNYVQKIRNVLGEPVVDTYKGGRSGGGGAKLTDTGKSLLEEYTSLEGCMSVFLANPEISEVKSVKLSARNSLKGRVVSVEKGVITAKVKVEIMVPATITSVITKEAVEDLDVKVGDEVQVVVKSTEVMIGK